METRGNFLMHVEVDGLPPDTFGVVNWQCTEGLSEITRIEVDALGPPDVDTQALLQKHARVKVFMKDSKGDETRVKPLEIPAIVTGITVDAGGHLLGQFSYSLQLQSRLYLTTLVQASRVFLDKSIKQIIKEVLEADGFVEGDDFEFKLKETYEPYEYTVQYQESDFDFISRLMEDEGIYYYISDRFLGASADAEIKDYLVILDNKEFHPERASDDWAGPVPYRPAQPHNPTGEGIGSFSMEHRVLPKEVLLKDYNYRKPTVEMKGKAPAEPKGFGTYFSYGDHFKTPEDGNALAEIRAQGILCRVKTWQGRSAVFDLEPALIFTLEDHPIGDWNGRYVITHVQHRGSQPGATLPTDDPASFKISYENSFTCIKADTQWRPELITPWPSIHGVIHATIDAAASGEYAELDDQGRYKVKLPFDLSDAKDGKASRYIRMVQPYSGAGMGMHFPLHKGTEVMLVHIDGDPDRPLIMGSVPNPDTQSPVAGKNQTQCAIHTGGGNKIVIEDSAGGQRIALSSPTSNTFFSIGAPPE